MSSDNIEQGIPAKDVETGSSTGDSTESREIKARTLSKVSKLYDIDGDGKLDELEQKMRDMDTEGIGHISNAKVYSIFQQQLQMQKQLLMAKRILIFFAVFLALLAVANIGIAFAAASLAKDTSTQNNVLVVKETGEVVATEPYKHVFDLQMTEERRRSLAEEDPNTFFTDSLCKPNCIIGESNETALYIRQLCILGQPVTVRLLYKLPGSDHATALTSYLVCNEGKFESILTDGEGEIRNGAPKIITSFNITDQSSNIAVGSPAGRRLNGIPSNTETYIFEDGGSLTGPWLFSVSYAPVPAAQAATAATTAP